MIRHLDFIEGTPTVVRPDRCVLLVESTEHPFDPDCPGGVVYSACYKDNPQISYEFANSGQLLRWLDEQGRIRLMASQEH